MVMDMVANGEEYMAMIKIRLLNRHLIRRYGRATLVVNELEAARLIKQGHAEAIETGFDSPPMNKMISSPSMKKEVETENPLVVMEKMNSPDQNGELTVTIHTKK